MRRSFLYEYRRFLPTQATVNETIGHQAEQYRRKADEVRATADATKDLACRDALRRLAGGYDRLAENLDRIVRRDGSSKPQKETGS